VDEVLEKKTEIFTNIKNVMTALIEGREGEANATHDITAKATELYNEFNNLLFKARNQLMSKEVILHDQMEVRDINLQKVSRIKLI